MITVEELKQKFPVRDVRPYGECIIVPRDEFDPDWEHYLAEQGFKCFFIDLDKKPVTLIRLKPMKDAGSMALRDRLERCWSPQEDELLIKLWNQEPKLNIPEIAAKIPGRSENGVKMRLDRLKKRGVIHLRLQRLGRPKKNKAGPKRTEKVIEAEPAGPEPATPEPSKAHTPAHTPVPFSINTTLTIQLSVNCNDRNAVENLFDIIEKMGLRKKEAST
jgi:hypothetical protein